MGRSRVLLLSAAVIAVAAAGCVRAQGVEPKGGQVRVVAAENFWGSLARQLGGTVTSIVTDPNADPHEYESTIDDARAVADADYLILTGAGYDDWMQKLLEANGASDRRVLVVADLLGKKAGDNPHFWYSPRDVSAVIDRITADLTALQPSLTEDFAISRTRLVADLQPYRARIASIQQRFHGAPIAATESIVQYLADELGLRLISPPAFMDAVSEGNEPPASSVAELQHQIASRQARALIYNVQTATAVTTDVVDLARSAGVPVVAVSETMQPPGATFEDWQVKQLDALISALSAG